jgi:hypothetical protein
MRPRRRPYGWLGIRRFDLGQEGRFLGVDATATQCHPPWIDRCLEGDVFVSLSRRQNEVADVPGSGIEKNDFSGSRRIERRLKVGWSGTDGAPSAHGARASSCDRQGSPKGGSGQAAH